MSLAHDLHEDAVRQSRITGILIGTVTDNQDPEGLGRVKVKYPRLPDVTSDWIPVASLFAGQQRGAFFLPEVEDEVLVTFEYGDINRPYIIGSVWNGQDTPPVAQEAQQTVRQIKTKSGLAITLTDTEGKEQIEITDANSNTITISSQNNTITLHSTQTLELKADKNITLQAPEVKINADESMTVDAGASLSLSAEGLSAEGTMIKLN